MIYLNCMMMHGLIDFNPYPANVENKVNS